MGISVGRTFPTGYQDNDGNTVLLSQCVQGNLSFLWEQIVFFFYKALTSFPTNWKNNYSLSSYKRLLTHLSWHLIAMCNAMDTLGESCDLAR